MLDLTTPNKQVRTVIEVTSIEQSSEEKKTVVSSNPLLSGLHQTNDHSQPKTLEMNPVPVAYIQSSPEQAHSSRSSIRQKH